MDQILMNEEKKNSIETEIGMPILKNIKNPKNSIFWYLCKGFNRSSVKVTFTLSMDAHGLIVWIKKYKTIYESYGRETSGLYHKTITIISDDRKWRS